MYSILKYLKFALNSMTNFFLNFFRQTSYKKIFQIYNNNLNNFHYNKKEKEDFIFYYKFIKNKNNFNDLC
ncbi:MAG: hypothetical protein A2Z98_10190 [Spirochaetes bacterium GWB1_27_13]|nr:MAG: hypothetical protein A2Z98_10190 [Spirochaetes bacterium GWB1_27_13]